MIAPSRGGRPLVLPGLNPVAAPATTLDAPRGVRVGDDPRRLDTAVRQLRLQGALELECSRRSALYFLENYYWTSDEHERKDPDKPLFHGPRLIDNETLMPVRELDGSEDDFLRYITLVWEREPLVAVPKSRQLRLSHLMMGCHGWLGMFHQGQKIAIQSKKFEDADALLDRLDNSLRITKERFPHVDWPHHKKKEGRILWPEVNSIMVAIAQGAEKTRSYTYSAILSDETAFQEQADDAFNAAVPTIEGGGKYTMISTADPGFFEEIVFDKLSI